MFNRTSTVRRLFIRPGQTLLTFSLCAATSFGAANYTSVRLGPTPDQPGAFVGAVALNNAGQAVGFEYVSNPNDQTLVLWNAGVPSTVPMPSGYQLAAPIFQSLTLMPTINAAGQILAPAIETASGSQVGVLFTGGTPVVIGPAPNTCRSTSTTVFGLNAAGHVLGTTSGGSCTIFWVWSKGTFTAFQPPEPTHFVLAGINDADHVLGVRCANVPVQSGCETGPIFKLEAGKAPVAYKLGANGISGPNNLDQVTGYALAGAGSDSFFWLSPTSWVGIPPSGPYSQQSCCYTNPNNAGYVVFSRVGAGPYAIMREGKDLGNIAGNFSTIPSPVALNDGMQFLAGDNLFSPAPGNCAPDVTSQVGAVQGKVIRDPSTGRFHQEVTLTNNGAPLTAPVSLLLDQLSPQVAVYGLRGTSTCSAPSGVPYVDLPASFGAAGSQVKIRIEFIDSAHASVSWTPRVLAGAGGR
jgi:hypothetical protein